MRDWFSFLSNGSGRWNNILYGFVMGVLLLGLVWIAVAFFAGYGAEPRSSVASESPAEQADPLDPADPISPSPTASTTDKQALRAAVLSNCHKLYGAQAQPLSAAATAMQQWQLHIAAMNQLVLGVISLQQANQFWNQTRAGAHANLRAFNTAAAPLRHASTQCPPPPRSSQASGTRGELVSCERAVAARDRVLHSARVALHTWSTHVMHMEMLRNGQMSAQQAQALWLHSWHEGQEEVTHYRAATEAARGMRC